MDVARSVPAPQAVLLVLVPVIVASLCIYTEAYHNDAPGSSCLKSGLVVTMYGCSQPQETPLSDVRSLVLRFQSHSSAYGNMELAVPTCDVVFVHALLLRFRILRHRKGTRAE